ncbi:MAG: hypothetical protein JO261_10035 [Alphaproteobacteria bacterium]|nr:hypothetical protein [Alphaproteobacteria bacterium]MBV9694028.1 hypothetical protein [Alphaproteobacteria bacterium]
MPSGLISVMPQAWMTVMPYFFSNASIIARGAAEPPITTRFMSGSVLPVFSRYCSSASHTVGTAAVIVTRSVVSSSQIESPSSFGPGSTSLAPTMGPENAIAQALAWNIGTTGRMASQARNAMASACAAISACSTLERWE